MGWDEMCLHNVCVCVCVDVYMTDPSPPRRWKIWQPLCTHIQKHANTRNISDISLFSTDISWFNKYQHIAGRRKGSFSNPRRCITLYRKQHCRNVGNGRQSLSKCKTRIWSVDQPKRRNIRCWYFRVCMYACQWIWLCITIYLHVAYTCKYAYQCIHGYCFYYFKKFSVVLLEALFALYMYISLHRYIQIRTSMDMYMFVHTCNCIYICVQVRVCTSTYTCIHTYMSTYIYIHYVRIHTYIYIYIQIHIHLHIYVHTFAQISFLHSSIQMQKTRKSNECFDIRFFVCQSRRKSKRVILQVVGFWMWKLPPLRAQNSSGCAVVRMPWYASMRERGRGWECVCGGRQVCTNSHTRARRRDRETAHV